MTLIKYLENLFKEKCIDLSEAILLTFVPDIRND